MTEEVLKAFVGKARRVVALIINLDEPFGGMSGIPRALLAKLAGVAVPR